MNKEQYEDGWRDSPRIYHNFDCESLKYYCFDWDTEDEYGIDSHGTIYRGTNLTTMRSSGQISKEFPQKTTFSRDDLRLTALLGYIQEAPDGSWFAHSPYLPYRICWIDVSGFGNECYAIRYLHQALLAMFPEEEEQLPNCQIQRKPIATPSYISSSTIFMDYEFINRNENSQGCDIQGNIWQGAELEQKKTQGLIIQEYAYKDVLLDGALIGYIRETSDNTWVAHSLFGSKTISRIEVCGFISERYAARYLHQIVMLEYPESVEDIPDLPWEPYVN